MAHKLDQHYSDFGGLDTRSNPLTQNPKSARTGSKNFRWNYEDKLQQAEGFQHKTENTLGAEAGIFEYKYRDVNTGLSRTETLGVSFDGNLRRRIANYLKLTRSVGSSVYFYSFFYDETVPSWRMQFLDSSRAVLQSINITTLWTLDDLKTAINALSLTGLVADVVDEDGASVTSNILAYLLDVTYEEEFQTTDADVQSNPAYDWEIVPCPYEAVPPFHDCFVTYEFQHNPEWSGVTHTNLHNACYICAGTFVYKYDGKSVYRSGLADLSRFQNYTVSGSGTSGSLTSSEEYLYAFQIGHTDYSGVEIVSKPFEQTTPETGDDAYEFTISGLQSTSFSPNRHFPIYSCCVDGEQTYTTDDPTITVKTGHNIKPGMCLRFHIKPINGDGTPSPYYPIKHRYLLVTDVTATTITIDGNISEYIADQSNPQDTSIMLDTNNLGKLWDELVINGAYVPDTLIGQSVQVDQAADFQSTFIPSPVYGAFFRIGRTEGDGETIYRLYDAPIPHDASWQYTFIDTSEDAASSSTYLGLSREPMDLEAGEALPRIGSVISQWQKQLVQCGVSLAYEEIVNTENYPNYLPSAGALYTGTLNFSKYQDNDFCDYQSFYWAHENALEGFPQSGAYEEDVIGRFNDQMRGVLEVGEALYAFKDRTFACLTGTLATGDIVKEIPEMDVGSANHNCLQEVNGAGIFMDENRGFYSVVPGRLPVFIGYGIQDYFKKNKQRSRSQFLNFRRAQSSNFRAQDQYICYIPAGKRQEGESGDFPDPTSSSVMFVFDYAETATGNRNCWYLWQGVNAAGGLLATADDELFISERQSSIFGRLWKQKLTGSVYDFSNHQSAIEFQYKPAFTTLGAPVIDKTWLKVWINSVLGGFTLRVDQYANFIDTIVGSVSITFASSDRTTAKMDVKAKSDKLSSLGWGFYHNTIHEAVTIDGWETEYSADFDLGEAKK